MKLSRMAVVTMYSSLNMIWLSCRAEVVKGVARDEM